MKILRGTTLVGVEIGLVVGMAVLAAADLAVRSRRDAIGPLLADCDGALKEIVVHYTTPAATIALPAYREFFAQLPASITVRVVCPDRAAFDDLIARIGPTRCTLAPVLCGHAMTCWSRDRWLALRPATVDGSVTLLLPRAEDGADIWPERASDARTGEDLAAASAGHIVAHRTALHFDGGDFVADERTVFVTPAVLLRNECHTVTDRDELVAQLGAMLRRRVVLLETAPDHHAGMFMMPIGDGRVLVGDPALARRLLDERPADAARVAEMLKDAGGADFSPATQRRFDAVADRCRAEGYRVVRMPTAPGRDGRTWLTWINVILDQRAGRRTVYLPIFRGADPLNDAAAALWRDLGFDVRRVDCTTTYRHFGSLRCLVNVLRRDERR